MIRIVFFIIQSSAFLPCIIINFEFMVGVNKLSLYFADRAIFQEITFIINKDDRIGLVGRNGAGKSTLLKSLAGIQKIDAGTISYPSDLKIGYLPQDMDFVTGKTVWDEVESAFQSTLAITEKIEHINQQLLEREDYESDDYLALLDDLAYLNEKLSFHGVDTMEAEIEKILLGLGFERIDFERQTDEFSGGWRMRIELAKILLQDSDLLLLDEPTNHLDIESIQWFEKFLKDYPAAVVLISHDRAFLDNLTKRTIEISMGKIYDYPVPYTKYISLRQERREHELAAYENQQKLIKDTEQFIDRFRAKATKAIQVQSRIKQLEKMDKIEIEKEDTSAMRFSFPPAPHSGKITLEAKDISKFYGDLKVFTKVNLTIERGEKVSFVGKNGQGKSTLSKLIVGEEPTSGTLQLGHQVKFGYYAQNQAEVLPQEKTVFEVIDDVAVGEVRKKIRTLLGSFLFSGDDIDKKVKILSGGERARLALCKMLLEPVNLLILDEPTNHLDIPSKDILKDALLRYDGTLIIISHDRDFLDGLTNKIYEFTSGQVKEHLGDINYFLHKKEAESISDWEKDKTKATTQLTSKKSTKTQNTYEEKKELRKKIKKIKNKLNKLESEIESLEFEISQFNKIFKNPETYSKEENNKALTAWEKTNNRLNQAMEDWERQQLLYEEVESTLEKLN